MKNGKYVLNYQHVCFEAPRLCFPICLIHIHSRLECFHNRTKSRAHSQKKTLIPNKQAYETSVGEPVFFKLGVKLIL